MEMMTKLTILADGAKYDVACTSSGIDRAGKKGFLGSTLGAGICHSFAADGRCISLLKVLQTNYCVYDCQYCVSRRSNDVPRAAFSPRELAELTINFYRRNYIEGLFLSSGVLRDADYTMEQMSKTLHILRDEFQFRGYIHAKTIPGASPELVSEIGMLADRISVNLELPSEQSLNLLAPDKPRGAIFKPMGQIRDGIRANTRDMTVYRHAPAFAPAGQSTQMIIGATPDTDYQIVRLAQSLYKKYALRRVFYSGYIPIGTNALLPQNQPVPMLREHRLYQADFLMRCYGFGADEILSEQAPHLDPLLDPKCNWALHNLHFFPVEINKAGMEELLRVPGIGPKGAEKIVAARRLASLNFDHLKKLNIVLKRAVYFITCSGKYMPGMRFEPGFIYNNLIADTRRNPGALPFAPAGEQLSLFPAQSFYGPGGAPLLPDHGRGA
ncbi:MAG: putative DNA modification/repair radical SAM protein [Oscillospiraceae bacterium]|jgi:putative DNA modification/repair radical SAM protein|nr:putative DNA modification/repair radical SAM protein [Oscillospiraceae bacterium]